NNMFKVIAIDLKIQTQMYINELYTVTPAVLTINNRFWVKGDSIKLLERRIQENLIKKYKDYYGRSLNVNDSFIQGIEIKNRKPIGYKYKNIRLMGNKFN